MRLCWLMVTTLLIWSPHTHCRDITTEDVRQAILSLVQMFRQSEDKLERHESRERVLGEHLKKMVAGLEKRHRALEPITGTISRLDDRLSNVETILFQKEEREKTQRKKTEESLDEIKKSIQSLTATVTKNIKATSVTSDMENNLTTNEDSVSRRLDGTDQKLDAIQKEIEVLKNNLSKESLRAMCMGVASDMNPFERHLSEAEKLLNKYELKLNEYNDTMNHGAPDVVPLSEVALADEAWHTKMTQVMERQEGDIKKIEKLLSDAESMWKELPRRAELELASNLTLKTIESIRHNLTESEDKSVAKITSKLREMSDKLLGTNEDIQNSLTESNNMGERVYQDVSQSYNKLLKEVQAQSRNEHVMIQMADDVIANKKRIEHGVHQILLEMKELMKAQTDLLNTTIDERINATESKIVGNQKSALAVLTGKIELEMTQVWRQIGIMYQQLLTSKSSLDKLTEQTEQYVNGSTITIGSVKQKVGLITTHVAEIGDSLNYLLGRLSIITHEFSQIKTSLGNALDKAHTDLFSVQAKIDNSGPGPHNITSGVKHEE